MNDPLSAEQRISTKQRYFFNILLILFPVISLLVNFTAPQYVADSRMHLQLAQNILHGFGHNFLQANPTDVSKTMLVPISFWPPGYSLMLLPFLSLHLPWWLIIAITDALAIVLFYWLLYKICRRVFQHANQLFILLLFAFVTFGLSPLGTFFALGTNIWALDFTIAGIFFLIKIYQNPEPPKWFSLLCFHGLVFLSVFFRYAYLPSAIILSFGSFFLFNSERKKVLGKSLLVPLVLYGGFFAYLKLLPDGGNYISTYHNSNQNLWHFENLLSFNAVITNSFLQPVLYHSTNFFVSLKQFTDDLHQLNARQLIFGILKFLFVALLCVSLIKLIVKLYKNAEPVQRKWYLLFIFLIAAQTAFIAILSMRYPPEVFKGLDGITQWTYVKEVRYFNFINLVLLFAGLAVFLASGKRRFRILLGIMLIYNIWVFGKKQAVLSSNPKHNISQHNFWVLWELPQNLIPPNAVFYEKPLQQRPSNYHYVATMYANKGVPVLKYVPPSQIKTSATINLVFAMDNVEDDAGEKVLWDIITHNNAYKLGTLPNNTVTLWCIPLKPGQTLTL